MPRSSIDGKNKDGIGILIGRPEPAAGGVEIEITRRLTAGGDVFEPDELSMVLHPENREAIMAPIGAVNEMSIRMDANLRRGAIPFEIGRQGGDGLLQAEGPFFRGIGEDANRRQ